MHRGNLSSDSVGQANQRLDPPGCELTPLPGASTVDHEVPSLGDAATLQKPTILLVDAAPINRTLLRRTLEAEGFDTLEAETGHQAIEIALESQPGLLLLDILIAEPDGYQVCEALKANPRSRHIPIVFLSALGGVEDRVRGLHLGAADYITKPFDRSEVVARVHTQVELQKVSRSSRQRQLDLEAELSAAAEIQKSLLPLESDTHENLEVLWHYDPCDDLGGDMLGVQELADGRVSMYLFDVSGHGAASALIAVAVTQYLSRTPGTILHCGKEAQAPRVEPSRVLSGLDLAYPIDRFSRHLTMAYLVVDGREGTLSYSCAAHPMPVLIRSSGELERLDLGGTVIGMGGLLPFEQGNAALHCGDRLLLFSDGLTESENRSGEPFGEERLLEILSSSSSDDLPTLRHRMASELASHLDGVMPPDDVTFLLFEWKGKTGTRSCR